MLKFSVVVKTDWTFFQSTVQSMIQKNISYDLSLATPLKILPFFFF